MTWLFTAVSAYSLLAFSALIDKVLLKPKNIDHPAVYAFSIGAISILALAFIPFVDFSLPGFNQALWALAGGAVSLFALYFYYRSADNQEISRVVPALAGFVPVFTFLGSYLFLGELLAGKNLFAFLVLVAGGVLASYESSIGVFKNNRNLGRQITAALFFSASFIISKYIFEQSGFWSGFIWIRLGVFLTAALFLAFSKPRQLILEKIKQPRAETSHLFLAGQSFGVLGAFLQNYAISLSSVVLVQALESVKYAVLLTVVFLTTVFKPGFLRERVSAKILIQKISAIILIGLGLFLLA